MNEDVLNMGDEIGAFGDDDGVSDDDVCITHSHTHAHTHTHAQ